MLGRRHGRVPRPPRRSASGSRSRPCGRAARQEISPGASFRRRGAAAIDHQNVVQITDFGELPRTPYFVMELLEESPFEDPQEDRAAPAVRAVHILQKVAAGSQRPTRRRRAPRSEPTTSTSRQTNREGSRLRRREVAGSARLTARHGLRYAQYMSPTGVGRRRRPPVGRLRSRRDQYECSPGTSVRSRLVHGMLRSTCNGPEPPSRVSESRGSSARSRTSR